jgi:predicted protein tyrosine phosphatase
MEFVVRSKREVEQENTIDEPHIIISIYTPFARPPLVFTNGYTKSILQLAFDDLDDPRPATILAMGEVHLFTEHMAEQIVAFVEYFKRKGVDTVVCHCDAGISRSPGVAAALSKFYNKTDLEFFANPGPYQTRRFVPNMRVYRTLLEKLNESEKLEAECRE